MSRHEPLHPDLVIALRVLDAFDIPYAEMWRLTRPVAARIGVPQPSYWRVRRFLIEERRRKKQRTDQLGAVLEDLFSGYPPRLDRFV